jgi:hypothetical protein
MVTVEDIKSVANRFLADNIRILVVGKGSEVVPHRELKNRCFILINMEHQLQNRFQKRRCQQA